MGDNSNVAVVPGSSPVDVKARSLWHAVTEIEQFSFAELDSNIPSEALTSLNLLSFGVAGMKSSALSVTLSFLTAPFSFCVLDRYLPVFGTTNPSLLDQIFSIMLSITPQIGFALLLSTMLFKVYRGEITKRSINHLVGGYLFGKLLVTLFFLYLFHWFYYRVGDNEIYWIADKLEFLLGFLGVEFEAVYRFLLDFRENFISSAWFVGIVSIITFFIVMISYFWGAKRSRNLHKISQMWF